MEVIATILLLLVSAAAFTGSIAWGVREFRARDASPLWLLFLLLFGPLTLLLWLMLRPKRLVDRKSEEFTNPDDQIAAAVRLETLGDIDAAIGLLEDASARWPEHGDYIHNIRAGIGRKLLVQGIKTHRNANVG